MGLKLRNNAFVTLRKVEVATNLTKAYFVCENLGVALDLAWEITADPHLPAEKMDFMRERLEKVRQNESLWYTIYLYEIGEYRYEVHVENLILSA